MDGKRFDRLTRATQTRAPRRALLAAALAGWLGLPHLLGADAGRKKRKKRKKNQSPPPPPPPPAACAEGQKLCRGTCIPSNQCCIDADCAALAPRCCQGTCIRTTECCTDSDCVAGTVCQAASCVCAAGAIQCGDICCAAPAGLLAKVTCGVSPDPICRCGVNLAEVCSGDCNAEIRNVSCTNPDIIELIENLCLEAGCGLPE